MHCVSEPPCRQRRSLTVSSGCSGPALTPLEFKSGKEHFTHAAQLALYFLLLESRYRVRVDRGLIWYSKEGQWQLVQQSPADIAGALTQLPLCCMHS